MALAGQQWLQVVRTLLGSLHYGLHPPVSKNVLALLKKSIKGWQTPISFIYKHYQTSKQYGLPSLDVEGSVKSISAIINGCHAFWWVRLSSLKSGNTRVCNVHTLNIQIIRQEKINHIYAFLMVCTSSYTAILRAIKAQHLCTSVQPNFNIYPKKLKIPLKK